MMFQQQYLNLVKEISTFKSMSHNVNLTLVDVIVDALILVKGVGGKLIFIFSF